MQGVKIIQSFFGSDTTPLQDVYPKLLSRETAQGEVYNTTTDSDERVEAIIETTKENENTTKEKTIVNQVLIEEIVYTELPVGLGRKNKNKVVRFFSYPSGVLEEIKWYKNDKLHKDDAPAVVEYYEDGKTIRSEQWYKKGQLYRYYKDYALIKYYRDGSVMLKKKYLNGQLDGPNAIVKYYPNKKVKLEVSYRDGELDGSPAVVAYDKNGKKKYEKWYRNNRLHNYPKRPAVIFYNTKKNAASSWSPLLKTKEEYYTEGVLMQEVWYENENRISRKDAPARIRYYRGEIDSEEWYENGEPHRENNEPAKTYYLSPDKIISQEWYKHGKRHRLHGPAKVVYDRNQNVIEERYFFNGNEYFTKEAYYRRLSLGIFKEPFLTEWFEVMRGGEDIGALSEQLSEEELEFLKKNGVDYDALLRGWYWDLYYKKDESISKITSKKLTKNQLQTLKENGIDYNERLKNIYIKLLHDQYKNNDETKHLMDMQLKQAKKDFPDQKFVEFRVI